VTATNTGEIQKRVAAGERDFQGASLSGVNLRGANLRGANLRGANLRGANLHGADLREAKLVRTDLGMADLGMTDFASSDLNGADFRGANLKGANFWGASLDSANLRGADLNGADLRRAKLVRVDLSRADLRIADLSEAELRGADLRGADLSGANLHGASLHGATLHGADLRSADLSKTNLRGANLTDTRLDGCSFAAAHAGGTVFADLDLRQVKGLESVLHGSPSTIGTDTLTRSQGRIPDGFLRGCGLAPWEILAAKGYDPGLAPAEATDLNVRVQQARLGAPAQRRRVLISHSEHDAAFVDQLRKLLLDRGVFAWAAPHESKGSVRERQSKLPIHHDLTLVLVLSKNCVQSDWVEHEVRLARKLEKSLGEEVLRPVSLDDSWENSVWHGRILEKTDERSVISFAEWQDSTILLPQFVRFFDSLDLFHR
jgi:uncharacterized protein YjbI with pentapeptide repeats